MKHGEGDIFTIPLRNGSVALGVLARSSRSGKILLGYFFPYRSNRALIQKEQPDLKPEDAIAILRFGALSAENDPSQEIATERCSPDTQGFEPDRMCGAGYVEIFLTKLMEQRIYQVDIDKTQDFAV